MKKNMGVIDRIIRILMAVTIVILYLTNVVTATAALVLLVISGILILTSLIGACPLYMPFRLSTITKKNK